MNKTDPFIIAREWDSFARQVLNPECGAVEKEQMRFLFYAGAIATLAVLINAFQHDDFQIMQNIELEMKDFAQNVRDQVALERKPK